MATLPMAWLYWHEDIISLPVDHGKWQGAIGTLELAEHDFARGFSYTYLLRKV